jgi:hypothetical protein
VARVDRQAQTKEFVAGWVQPHFIIKTGQTSKEVLK